jgi:hypothetical protein
MTQANNSHEHQFGKFDLFKSIPINIVGTLKFNKYFDYLYLFQMLHSNLFYLLSKRQ